MKEKPTKAEWEALRERARTAPQRMRALVAKNDAERERRRQEQSGR